MMKYVFVLVLLIVGGVASVLGANVAYRWFHNMTESPRIMPGERAFVMPPGSVPRGGEVTLPKEEREATLDARRRYGRFGGGIRSDSGGALPAV